MKKAKAKFEQIKNQNQKELFIDDRNDWAIRFGKGHGV